MTSPGAFQPLRRLPRSRRAIAVAAACLVIAGVGALIDRRLRATPPPAPVLAAAPARAVKIPAPVFPLTIGPSGRYLVDQRDRPFLIIGDSPQALVVNASEAQAARYIANRGAAGFNSLWINLLSNKYTGGRAGGTTFDGIRPFTVPGDLSTPNERYFARADAMLEMAARQHIAVFLDPIETGGWLNALRHNGVAKDYAFGRYLGRHFRRFRNIVWVNGNDFQSWHNPHDDALAIAVARGIHATDPGHLQSVELSYLVSSSLDDQRWRGLIGLDAAYTYRPTYAEISNEYARAEHLPIFLVEAHYEGEWDYRGPQTLRRQEYWSVLSGASGEFYGNKYTWPLLHGWLRHLDTIGSRQLTFARNLFATHRWNDLVPDTAHKVLVSGFGTFRSDGSVNDSDYVTAAATPDGKLMIAYLPSQHTVGVDLSRFAGRVSARWYDPSSGTFVDIPGSPFAAAGTRRFAPGAHNRGGDGDWVLVLTAT